MPVYLVQHGTSHPPEIDPERGLTDGGIAEVETVAAEAARKGVMVARVVHSGKTRARQTAEIFARHLCGGAVPSETDGMGPNDSAAAFAERLDPSAGIMYVGHLPFMERLVSHLVAGSIDRPVVSFRNGGIVCLDADPHSGSWVILWAMVPRHQ